MGLQALGSGVGTTEKQVLEQEGQWGDSDVSRIHLVACRGH